MGQVQSRISDPRLRKNVQGQSIASSHLDLLSIGAISAAQGGGICAACERGSGMRLPAESLHFLAGLQALKGYSKAALPHAPARRGEIRAARRSFLDHPLSAGRRVRTLAVLASLAGRSPGS